MAFPLPPSPPAPINLVVVCRLTQFFNCGTAGWSESYFCNVAGNTNPLLAMDNWSYTLNAARRQLLAANCSLVASRTQLYGTTGRPSLSYEPDGNLGVGLSASNTQDASQGWIIRWSDVTGQAHDTRIYRGMPYAMITLYNPAMGPGATAPTALAAGLNAMKAALANQYTVPDFAGGGSIRPFMPQYDRSQAQTPLLAATGVSVGGNGGLVFVTSSPAVIPQGTYFKVHVQRLRCVKGVSGRYLAISSINQGSQTTIGTSKSYCCNPNDLSKLVGYVMPISPVGYPYTFYEAERPSNKKTGRAFFVSPGRRQSRCC